MCLYEAKYNLKNESNDLYVAVSIVLIMFMPRDKRRFNRNNSCKKYIMPHIRKPKKYVTIIVNLCHYKRGGDGEGWSF